MTKPNDKKKRPARKVKRAQGRGEGTAARGRGPVRGKGESAGSAARGRGPGLKKVDQGRSAEVEELRARLAEAEDTLRAIRSGEVDGLVVAGPQGDRVYTLQGADEPYRILVEQMQEGAVTLAPDGTVLYCNRRVADMLGLHLESLIAGPMEQYIAAGDRRAFGRLLRDRVGKLEATLVAGDGTHVPVQMTANALRGDETRRTCLVVTDLTEQKRNEELVAAERLARSILDHATEAIAVCDTQGRILRVNDAARQLCSGNPVGQLFSDTLPLQANPPEAGQPGRTVDRVGMAVPSCVARALEGKIVQGFEATLLSRNQIPYELLISAGPLFGDAEQIVGAVVMLTDITQRKRAEVALRDSEESLRFIMAAARLGGWDLDLATHSARRSLLHDRIFGYEKLLPQWTYETFLEHVVPEDRELVDRKFRQAVEQKQNWEFECRIIRRDGQIRWIWACGQPQCGADSEARRLAGLVQDITERKLAQEALQRRTDELDRYFSIDLDLICVVEEGRFAVLNPAWTTTLGYDLEALRGRHICDVLHPHDVERMRKSMEEMRTERKALNFTNRCRCTDGSQRWIEWSAVPVEEGNRIYCVGRDVTQRIQFEERLQALNEELARKKEEMEQFMYSVSHDLKSPLVTITGFAGLLNKEAAAGRKDRLSDHVERIENAASRMGRLIDDLLKFSRIGRIASKPTIVNLGELIHEVVRAHSRELTERTISVLIQEDMPIIQADRDRLYQVLDNLVVNAIKYGSGALQPRIEIGGRAEADETRLFVKDNGQGIAPEFHKKVFELFHRLDHDQDGAGVGLAIVKRTIEMHGGRAWVESHPGEGASFWLSLPMGDAPHPGTAPLAGGRQ